MQSVVYIYIYTHTHIIIIIIRAITGPSCPEGSRKLRFPDYVTMGQDGDKVVSRTRRPHLPQGNILISAILYQVFVVYKCLHCCACVVTSRFCASNTRKCVFVLDTRIFTRSCVCDVSAVVLLQVLLIADVLRRCRSAVL